MAMKLTSLEDLKNRDLGPIGTPKRDEFERKLADEIRAYRIGEAIKMARESQSMTQEELGKRMGVQRAQVCRIESGKSITFASMMRAFKALGVQVSLDMKGVGSVLL